MKTNLLPVFFGLLWLFASCGAKKEKAETAGAPELHPDSSGWSDLFAADLSDAVYPEGIWYFEEGVLTATEDQNIWTSGEYDNFTIDLEFKNDSGTNSGVIVYCSDPENWIPNSVEIQIADDFAEQWAKSPRSWQCGAFFGHQPASKSNVKPAGEWNRYTITCVDSKITVTLNGETVNEIDLSLFTSAETNPDGSRVPSWLNKAPAELPTRGRIGLQGKHAGAPVYFRNLKIKAI
jgi:hypothetical protein